MKILTYWKNAPPAVKWTSLLWLGVGVAVACSSEYSALTFIDLPVRGLTGAFITEVSLQVGIAGLVIVAGWNFLLRAAWGRVVLEVASWLTLIYYAIVGAGWVGSAIFAWDEFRASVANDLSEINSGSKLILGILLFAAMVAISAVVIRVLRSAAVRQYVINNPGQATN